MADQKNIDWVIKKVSQHLITKFHGTISFRIEAGKITYCTTQYTEKPMIDDLKKT